MITRIDVQNGRNTLRCVGSINNCPPSKIDKLPFVDICKDWCLHTYLYMSIQPKIGAVGIREILFNYWSNGVHVCPEYLHCANDYHTHVISTACQKKDTKGMSLCLY